MNRRAFLGFLAVLTSAPVAAKAFIKPPPPLLPLAYVASEVRWDFIAERYGSSSLLTDEDRQKVERYLAEKWGFA